MLASTHNFEELTKGLSTKSDKIRALAREGVPTADIARYLDIKYQHARNVLVDCGLHQPKQAPAAAANVAASPVRSIWTAFDKAGGLVIPAELLQQAGLAQCEPVYIGVTSEGIELLSQKAVADRLGKIAAKYKRPGISEVDEFIKDRRREAERENAKFDAIMKG
jgi:bifunctional DNA-binding transcriptional regulator/antitoxin component of YhaV-PrlF toxin-antitoxin module